MDFDDLFQRDDRGKHRHQDDHHRGDRHGDDRSGDGRYLDHDRSEPRSHLPWGESGHDGREARHHGRPAWQGEFLRGLARNRTVMVIGGLVALGLVVLAAVLLFAVARIVAEQGISGVVEALIGMARALWEGSAKPAR